MKKKVIKKKVVKNKGIFEIKDVRWVSLKEIKLWKNNPRIQTEEGINNLAALLEKHGFKSPLVVWNKNKVIYKGNTSYKAAKFLKLPKVPVAFVDFPSLVAAQAYGVSDNKSSEYSEWDVGILSDLMEAREMREPEMTGFESKEISHLLMEPDMSKLHKMQESSEGILSLIKLVCKPEHKDKIIKYLDRTLMKAFKNKVVVK